MQFDRRDGRRAKDAHGVNWLLVSTMALVVFLGRGRSAVLRSLRGLCVEQRHRSHFVFADNAAMRASCDVRAFRIWEKGRNRPPCAKRGRAGSAER